MKHGVKFTYEEVKNYVEVESGSGCKLISTEYIRIDEKLEFKCLCGTTFITSFSKFKNRNKRQCNECSLKKQAEYFKLPYDEVKLYLSSKGYELISEEYINTDTPIHVRDVYGYHYFPLLYNIKTGQNMSKFETKNPYIVDNIKLWCKKNEKTFILMTNKYESPHLPLQWKCLKESCNELFYATWADISQHNGCPFCAGKQVGLSNCLATKNPELAKEWHPTKNGELTPLNVTSGSNRKVFWLCSKCNNEWITTIASRNSGNGCSKCKQTKGEIRISNILSLFNVVYHVQYMFNNCKYIRKLPFDFYLPDYNMVIEYQGEQHYMPIDFAGKGEKWAIKQLETNKNRDEIKRTYCRDNNITLIEIPYWDYVNIENILEPILLKQ